jgi:hypothetical protein
MRASLSSSRSTAAARRIAGRSFDVLPRATTRPPTEELRANGLDKHLVDGLIRQIRPSKSSLASFNRENLLFICSHDYQHYRFAHFKPPAKDTQTAPLTPVELVLSKLPDAKPSPNGRDWQARCPAHDDRNPSLSIAEGEDGRALLRCHAGCATEAVVAAMGIRMADLMPTTPNQPGRAASQQIVKAYDYRDEHGDLLFQVVRMEPKTFRQRAPQPGGGWSWSVKDVRKVLYRLPELVGAEPDKVVFVPEGEKDVDRLMSLGLAATCNPGGAEKWKAEYGDSLRDRLVAILPDNDEVGQQHAQAVARSLTGIAKAVKIIDLPGLQPKGDVSDWLDAGRTREELIDLVKAAALFHPLANTPAVPKSEEWGTIEPLGIVNVPPFPVGTLPGVLAEFVAAEAEATQTPPDLAAMLCLAVCAAAVAKKVEVHVRDQWFEPVDLFTVAVLETMRSGGHGTRTDDVRPIASNGLRDPADAVGTETGTVGDDSGPVDPDLRAVIDAWAQLSEATRRRIRTLAEGAAKS